MKIRKNILILTLALAAVLTGCGSVEDEARAAAAPEPAGTTVGTENNENSSAEESTKTEQEAEAHTVADPRQAPETMQTTEPPQTTETTPQVTEPPAETTGQDGQNGSGEPSGEVLTPENIDGVMFGFELFSDGHKNCWEQRYDCAKVMLEAAAQTNPAEDTVDLTVDVGQLNEKESVGFMTWLKFEEPMSFRVGDTVMSGNTLNIIDYDGGYYLFNGEIEEMRGMIRLDDSFIPKILEAAGC